MANRFEKYANPFANIPPVDLNAPIAQGETPENPLTPMDYQRMMQPGENRFSKYAAQEQFGPPAPTYPETQQAVDPGYVKPKDQRSWGDFGRVVFDQALQGATFGGADEFTDRLGALIASGVTGQDYNDLLKEARTTTRDRLNEQMQEMPVTSIGANIAGGLLTGAAGASTKAGAAIGDALRSGNTLSRVVKAIPVGAASGGLYGFAAGEDGERAESAYRGAVLGAVTGAALPVAAAGIKSVAKGTGNIGRGIVARGEDALNSAADDIAQRSNNAYARMRSVGAEFNPKTVRYFSDNIEDALVKDGPLNRTLHRPIIAAVRQMSKDGFKDLEQLDQWRQVLGDIAGNFSDKANARKASLLRDKIDELVENIHPGDLRSGSREAVDALLEGRKEWARKARFETVADIVKGAAGDANKLKRDLEKLRLNPKKTRGWSKEEISALGQASKQTTGEGILKALGKFGFDLGSGRAVGNTALPVIGGIIAGVGTGSLGPAAAITIAGTLARSGQKALAAGKAENLLRTIERGGQVSTKQIMSLPPKEAQQVLTALRAMQAPNAAVAYQSSNP